MQLVGSHPCLTTSIDSSTEGLPDVYHNLGAVFSKEKASCLPPHHLGDCAIELLPNTTPPKCRVYPLPLPETHAMDDYIKEALAVGHILPSTSPAAAGFFFVEKKDGGLRPCIDYRGLNAITVCYPYPLPLVSAALEQLQRARIFTKLDLRSAYNLVHIKEGDEWKTAFHTTQGHYEYLVMPYGLTKAPAVFQALINELFHDLFNHFVIAYIDDILIYSASLTEHVQHVCTVLTRLKNHELYAKLEKCEFHRTTLSFLGFLFTVTYCPGYKSSKADALSWLHETPDTPASNEPILQPSLVVGPVQWNLVEEVHHTHAEEPPPSTCPPTKLYVSTTLCHRVMQWTHESPSNGHPGIHRTA
ncbi:hypothetical protein QTP70_001226 [Hemibagrus guttatus]|uniref:ribonuclease H n=1 Tax=Hemibagrus guttatus TaxID=175788 RepID=A0AAE0V3X4_9TELE|nr:hypothetical protein QTP70_001226 [Hemibagrus guttatus]